MIFTLDLKFPIFSGDFVSVFMVPLFFFISGYVAYKPVETWKAGYTSRKLLGKARLLLIPTVFFFLLFIYTTEKSWWFPGGYWFTMSLFEMFLIYYAVSFLSNKLCPKYYTAAIISATLGMMALTVVTFGTTAFGYLLLYELRVFIPYFILGILAGKFKSLFTRWIHNDFVITSCILVCIVGAILVWKVNILEINHVAYSIVYGLMRIALIFLLFYCFQKSEEYWTRNTLVPTIFRTVGRRTLDIYMIHYFFIWPAITPLTEFLTAWKNEMLIIPICLIFTAIAISLSLLVSHLLRSSKFLSKWLFAS